VRVTPGIRLEYFAFDRHILRTRVRREVRDSTGTAIGSTFSPEDVDLRSGGDVFEVIPGVGVSWFASDRASVFAGVHRGFAPPRVKDALILRDDTLPPGQQPGDPVSLQLDAEHSWNLELGTRSQPVPGVFLEVAAFYLDFSNQIIEPSLSAGAVAQAALANQGATDHRGLEAALGVDWGHLAGWGFSLRTDVSYTYSDARFANDRYMVDPSGDTVNVNGNRLAYAPEHLLTVSATLAAPGRYSLHVDRVHVGAQFADNFETRAVSANGRNGLIPAQTVWNAAGTLRVSNANVRVVGAVKNLLDAGYIASRRPEGIKPGLRRHVQLGVEWEF
jgi:Fe(3+) dicitrate transport protein